MQLLKRKRKLASLPLVYSIIEVKGEDKRSSVQTVFADNELIECFKEWLRKGYSCKTDKDGVRHVVGLYVNDILVARIAPDSDYLQAAIAAYHHEKAREEAA